MLSINVQADFLAFARQTGKRAAIRYRDGLPPQAAEADPWDKYGKFGRDVRQAYEQAFWSELATDRVTHEAKIKSDAIGDLKEAIHFPISALARIAEGEFRNALDACLAGRGDDGCIWLSLLLWKREQETQWRVMDAARHRKGLEYSRMNLAIFESRYAKFHMPGCPIEEPE
uniref:Uncharacterized protein n=1 Tax=Candidatus Kentrum sp. UNK TaxID=2126344 RepID=A0A450ZWZ2_9GAMM|nr:MAG: hypothetical protein BECKUNK1418G_GA0071005_100271 [Candidatus Kentron sp. UNK]VFK68347.1 MAG: hypothetical protein BECKUNK1418H_GA0071006_100171 [Candidatus Kentron sp. UNK]